MQIISSIKCRFLDLAASGFYYFLYRKNHRKYCVLGNRQVGIGNRLIALANMYSWAGKEDITLAWSLDDWVPVPFDDLFEMSDAPGFEVCCANRHWWSRQLSIPEMPMGATEFWQLWVPPAWREGLMSFRPNDRALFCRYNEMPQWAREIYTPFFSQLKPSLAVKKRIDSCVLPDDVIRVQVRNSLRKNDCSLVSHIERYIEAMKKYPPSQIFFISCLEKEYSDVLRREFHGRIIELPGKNYHSLVDAVADMWILGGGHELICQWGSTFSEVAWWWRGCKAKVTTLPYEYRQCSLL